MATLRTRFLPALLAVAAGAAGCAPPVRPVPAAPAAVAPAPERVRVRSAGVIRSVLLEEYVVDTILGEVSPVGDSDDVVRGVFELQAIVARTYAVSKIGRHRSEGFDVCDTTHCQIYEPARRRLSRFTAVAIQAAASTRGQLLTYDAQPIQALFHADCGGTTAAADEVWGGMAVPYLRAHADDVPGSAHRAWRVLMSRDEVRAALNDDPRTSVGRTLTSIDIQARDESGRAAGLGIRGERSFAVRGDVLRSVLNQRLPGFGIQSTLFTLTISPSGYVFEGRGFGHGVGLCQRGAAARLRRGETVSTILATYYPGTRLRAH